MFTIQYWAEGLNGDPVLVSYQLRPHPMYWPANCPNALIFHGDVEVPPSLIEEALDWGWGYNPHTRCFYRLD